MSESIIYSQEENALFQTRSLTVSDSGNLMVLRDEDGGIVYVSRYQKATPLSRWRAMSKCLVMASVHQTKQNCNRMLDGFGHAFFWC